ncbi:hypothetical protein NQ318_002208 [Aromia moschata]|uniref:Gamma-interferon-inducible lysosomal thiol reductase n=1 Tax=Aromia moschata TaxID=1265417 RepID=A0AAV8Z5C4_9CUCU|nr:hypothetical protein NQ318_002208 [Aromia moschata]
MISSQVNVAVYYESLCPDSRKFFTKQLYPSLQTSLSNFVNLTLVPYGKTTAKFDINSYQFECHHGPGECQGNKIQACALKLIHDDQNSKDYNKVAVGFINCLMDKAMREGDNATFPTMDCAQLNHVHNIKDIENCAGHSDASNYLAYYGGLTDKIQKPLKSVPTIVFNNQLKDEDSKMAQTSFVKVLCQYIEHDKPEECLKNGALSLKISLGFVLLMASFSRHFL